MSKQDVELQQYLRDLESFKQQLIDETGLVAFETGIADYKEVIQNYVATFKRTPMEATEILLEKLEQQTNIDEVTKNVWAGLMVLAAFEMDGQEFKETLLAKNSH